MIVFNPRSNCLKNKNNLLKNNFRGSFYIVPQCKCIRNQKFLSAAAEDIGNRKVEHKQHRIIKYLIAIALAIVTFP